MKLVIIRKITSFFSKESMYFKKQ